MGIALRRFVALLALLALSASMVEQSWAAACLEMDSSPDSLASPHALHGADAVAVAVAAADEEPGDSTSEPLPCPMALVAGPACGVVALPTLTQAPPLGVLARLTAPVATDDAPASLSLCSLFRPPRR